jgi:ABC-type polysaccharide/polyol phosphate export permease
MPSATFEFRRTLRDLAGGVRRFDAVNMLVMRDLRHRYRRSTFGPFWITISMGVWIATLAFVFTHVFNTDPARLLPFVSISILLWAFFSTCLSESCVSFINNEELIKASNLPLPIFLYKIVWSNIIVLLHNIVLFVAVMIYYGQLFSINIAAAMAGFSIFVANCLWIMLLLAVLSARFRDIPQIVANALQVMFYLTPVIWLPDYVESSRRQFIDWNPLYHIIECVRSALLAQPWNLRSVTIACTIAVIGWIVALATYARYRKAIPYWL